MNKSKIYSCTKFLENLHNESISAYNGKACEQHYFLETEYSKIVDILQKELNPDELKFVAIIKPSHCHYYDDKKEALRKLCIAISNSITFLQSLDMDFEKELVQKKKQLTIKEEELERRDKELTHMRQLLKKSMDVIKQLPELHRSKTVEEIKKSHRQIEEHTNSNSKSQNN